MYARRVDVQVYTPKPARPTPNSRHERSEVNRNAFTFKIQDTAVTGMKRRVDKEQPINLSDPITHTKHACVKTMNRQSTQKARGGDSANPRCYSPIETNTD